MKVLKITFVISSESSEKLQLAKEIAIHESQLDTLRTDVGTANENIEINHYRLRDYFNSIEICYEDTTSFRLTFTPRCNANRYWKDLIVLALLSIRKSGAFIKSSLEI